MHWFLLRCTCVLLCLHYSAKRRSTTRNVTHCVRITSTKSLSFCMTTFSFSLAYLTVLLPQSRDCQCYISRRTLLLPPSSLRKNIDLRTHYLAHCPDLWNHITCAWSKRLCVINPGIHTSAVQTGPGAHPASYTTGTVSFPGVKRPGSGVDHPTPSSNEVKERVELYLYPPSGPSWPVLGWALPLLYFTFTYYSINNPYPTAFPYGNGMVLHFFYQQQESSTTKTVHKVINKGLKTYV